MALVFILLEVQDVWETFPRSYWLSTVGDRACGFSICGPGVAENLPRSHGANLVALVATVLEL